MFDSAHSLPPPLKVAPPHRLPVIKRDAPILAPFLGELVIFEIRLGRRSPGPIQRELVRLRKHIGAVITHAERDVAHDRYTASLSVGFNVAPLLMGNPLHVAKEILA